MDVQGGAGRAAGVRLFEDGLGDAVSGGGRSPRYVAAARVHEFSDELTLGVRGWGSAFRVPDVGFRISDFGFWVSGSGFRSSGSGFRILGSGFRVQGFGLRGSGLE